MNIAGNLLSGFVLLALFLIVTNAGIAQPPGQIPQFVSPEVTADRHITFRVYAPHADSVRLSAGDIPGQGSGAVLTKSDSGVWEVTLGPIDPGAYRYTLNINGVPTIDPRNPVISESNNSVWSEVYVPGAAFMDTTNVPHGAVAAVTYYSTALSKFRRMHIYTPPGYEDGKGKYPVFYLLHGAGDSDDSWSSEGRAGFILDNLIAAKKAVPMIVVMPAGHTRGAGMGFSTPRSAGTTPPDEFTQDFTTDIMPYIESHYRTINDRAHRAIAGLSMGGMQTLNAAIPQLEKFAYIGVFSSGLFGIVGPNQPGAPTASTNAPPASFPWEEEHKSILDDVKLKQGVKLFWFGTGKDDFLLATTKATVDMFKKHGFAIEFEESSGAHTWINWRNYLNGFAPRLFR